MNWLLLLQHNFFGFLIGVGVVLTALFVIRLRYTLKQYGQSIKPKIQQSNPSHNYPFTISANAEAPPAWESDFARFLEPLILAHEPFPASNSQMLKSLLCYRFPFSHLNMGQAFPQAIQNLMYSLPPVLIQLLYKYRVPIELDMVSEIPAMMDPHAPKIMLSRLFVADNQLFESAENPVYPYGLEGLVIHELGHFLDWFIQPESGRLSATPTFLSAFQEDINAIPPELIQSFETCSSWRDQYGGVLSLPPALRYQSDLSLFINQEEEVFGEAVLYLMTHKAREVVLKHFPRTIEAVRQLLSQAFLTVAHAAHELPLS